jgi:periplasmic divalent cation tolerance protein
MTEQRLVEATTQIIVELHPYETPCVLTIPVESGAKGYLTWLAGETFASAASERQE